MQYTIEQISTLMGARLEGHAPQAIINWLLTDSRSLSFPEETLFFALTTKRNSGARYIAELYARGVRNFVVGEQEYNTSPSDFPQDDTANYLIVSNPLKALQKLAEQHRERFHIPIIGITGSNGKNYPLTAQL